jgi:hypothetical protein
MLLLAFLLLACPVGLLPCSFAAVRLQIFTGSACSTSKARFQMADRDIVAEAEGLYAKCREHLATDRLQSAFVHLHPEHASQFSLLKREYLRFVVLKLLEKDTAADAKLSPSLAVDKMWHSHVLVRHSTCLLTVTFYHLGSNMIMRCAAHLHK